MTARPAPAPDLTPAEWSLMIEGLEHMAETAQFDADHGGSDNPAVARRLASEASSLRKRLLSAGLGL